VLAVGVAIKWGLTAVVVLALACYLAALLDAARGAW
jgi:hypothetical protein